MMEAVDKADVENNQQSDEEAKGENGTKLMADEKVEGENSHRSAVDWGTDPGRASPKVKDLVSSSQAALELEGSPEKPNGDKDPKGEEETKRDKELIGVSGHKFDDENHDKLAGDANIHMLSASSQVALELEDRPEKPNGDKGPKGEQETKRSKECSNNDGSAGIANTHRLNDVLPTQKEELPKEKEEVPNSDEKAKDDADKQEDNECGSKPASDTTIPDENKSNGIQNRDCSPTRPTQVVATKKTFYSEEVCVKIVNSASSKNLTKWIKQCGLPDRKNSHKNRQAVLSFIDSIIERKVQPPHSFVTSVADKLLSESLDTELSGFGITLSGQIPVIEKKRILREHITNLAKFQSSENTCQSTDSRRAPPPPLQEETNSCLSDSTADVSSFESDKPPEVHVKMKKKKKRRPWHRGYTMSPMKKVGKKPH